MIDRAPDTILLSERNDCVDPEADGGSLHLLSPGESAPTWTLPFPDVTHSSVIPTHGGQGLFGYSRTVEPAGFYLHDLATGEETGSITAVDGAPMSYPVFADDYVVLPFASGTFAGIGTFRIEDVIGGVSSDGAVAMHSTPPGTCCGFGLTNYVGDPTGDGLDDVVVVGGGAWLLDGSLLDQDEGILAAQTVDIVGYAGGYSLGPTGDLNGDGYSDFSAGSLTAALGGTVQFVAGGSLTELATLTSSEPRSYVGLSVSPAGRSDGAEADSVVILNQLWEPWQGGDSLWLVAGPLCNATYVVQDVGTPLVTDAPVYLDAATSNERMVLSVDALVEGAFLFLRL